MNFLSIGECMAELSPSDIPGQFSLGFGGDSFNTAWYLRRLRGDATVSYFTAIGDDSLSEQMLQTMQRAGIRTKHIVRVPGKSIGLYLIRIEDGERSFSYWRDTSAARHFASDSSFLESAVLEADLIYFSGITLAILDPSSRSTYLGVLQKVRKLGKKIAFDPNLRLRLWKNADEMTAAIMQASAISDIVLPSFEDEAKYFSDGDTEDTVERYAKAGCEIVVVKNGSSAVRYMDGHTTGVVQLEDVKNVIDTTAAGDSFNAGFLAELYTGKSIPECISGGVNVASQVIQQKGALVQFHV